MSETRTTVRYTILLHENVCSDIVWSVSSVRPLFICSRLHRGPACGWKKKKKLRKTQWPYAYATRSTWCNTRNTHVCAAYVIFLTINGDGEAREFIQCDCYHKGTLFGHFSRLRSWKSDALDLAWANHHASSCAVCFFFVIPLCLARRWARERFFWSGPLYVLAHKRETKTTERSNAQHLSYAQCSVQNIFMRIALSEKGFL